jgi:hypothetical protein
MYAVAGSGALMAIMVLAAPLVIRAGMISQNTDLELLAYRLRIFWVFLFYLSILSFTTTRHAFAVLKVKDKRNELRTFSYLSPIVLLLVGAPMLFYIGYANSIVLHMVFSVLGFMVGMSMLRYCLKEKAKAREWIIEHITSTIGSGIGAYTAFIAFGGRTLLSDLGEWQMLFWIAPGVIGSIASAVLCRKYAGIFNIRAQANA